ncbi:unnamed protein product [Moneuplotes crassus]|uniref:Uncharacterized protein n=1 Tax=Euplotes crassus TaxID=5936 RepID=A0AAD1Y1C6_EUPCR|nr:unnamed protein product [Moneuplotes crassus]
MDSAVQEYDLTFQRILYGSVLIFIPLILLSQKNAYRETFSKLRVLFRVCGVVIIGICSLFLFNRASKYFANEDPPAQGEDCLQQKEFVEWQKFRHKLERDMYLSALAIVSSLCIMLVSHWMHKYYSYIDYKNAETNEERKN